VFRELPTLDYKRRYVAQMRKALPDTWHDRFAILFRNGTYDSLDLVARTLKEEGHEELLQALVSDITEDDTSNTETYFWIARSRLSDRSLCPDPGKSDLELFRRFLRSAETVFDRLSNPKAAATRDADKTLIQRYRAFLADKDYAALWKLMDAHSPDDRRLIYSRTLKNRALGEFFKSAFDARAADRFEGIAAKQETVESLIPSGTIFGTAAGRTRKEDEVRQLREIELPRVAEALATAKAQGDLSENAEHDAALEKKQEIDGRLASAGVQLQRFKEITRSMFDPNMVFVGSRVTLLNMENNQHETVAILGPWDVDVEHGIISYESEKGAILIGKQVGQHVHLDLPSKSFDWEVVANVWYEDTAAKTA
jgi:transcription elongation factor GreA